MKNFLFVLVLSAFFLFLLKPSVYAICPSVCDNNVECRGCATSGTGEGWYCLKYPPGAATGHCQPPDNLGGGGAGGGNGVAINLPCNCTTNFSACGDKFGKTNIQWRQCTPAVNGAQTCNWRVLTTLYQYKTCANTTVTPAVTGTPTPTENPNCKCSAQGTCTTQCQFNKFTTAEVPGVSYSNPIKCGLADSNFKSVPTADQKTGWCQTENRTKGDADGNGNTSLKDYFYYVAAKFGAKIPPTVNPDFNGDDKIDEKDGEIIIKSIVGGSAADE